MLMALLKKTLGSRRFALNEQENRYEFSKVIFWLVWSTNLLVILFSAAMIVRNFNQNGYFDTSLLTVLIPSTAAELGAATGFYYWKTRTNNVYEYGEKFIIDLVESGKIDNQHVVQIAQAFFNSSQLANATQRTTK